MAAALFFYGALVAMAMWASARDENLRWIGASIAASYSISNVIWFAGTIPQRPGIYSMLEMFVILTTYLAFEVRRERILILIVVVSSLSICANIALAVIEHPVRGQIRMHEILTNLCFGLECLLLFAVGVRDGVRSNRFHHWPFLRHGLPASHAAKTAGDA